MGPPILDFELPAPRNNAIWRKIVIILANVSFFLPFQTIDSVLATDREVERSIGYDFLMRSM